MRQSRDRQARRGRSKRSKRSKRSSGSSRSSGTTAEETLVNGTFVLHPSGRGFVVQDDAHEDLVIAPNNQGGALDGDTVVAAVWSTRGRPKGRVVEVTARGRTRLVGVLARGWPRLLTPDDPRILSRVEVADVGSAREGQVVLAKILQYPDSPGAAIQVTVSQVLGEPGLLTTHVSRCIAGSVAVEQLPQRILDQASALPARVRDAERSDRLDLRDHHFVTIDPLLARDFDDAVAVEPGPSGTLRVWVAVADVSHYVHEESAIDEEAARRGCSIYLPDRAIHMLPEALASGICSLVPQRDRLAMVVRLDVDEKGEVKDDDCMAAVIHSRGRLDYAGVAAALQGQFSGRRADYLLHAELLENLHRVASVLRARRLHRGGLDLDLPEAQVMLDQDDPQRIRDIVPSRPNAPIKRAYSLIEELMIAANEAIARQFIRSGQETLWRIHPAPQRAALDQLAIWLTHYGFPVRGPTLASERAMSRLVQQLQGHPAGRPLTFLVLRTLKQAVYGVNNVGHFGLASPAYLHFTSPIRRYPDLHVHRLLKRLLRQQGRPAGQPRPVIRRRHRELVEIARQSTACERRAVEVEREVLKVYAASLMRDRIGDCLEGTISGITSFGFFVTLDAPFVEGLVRAESIEDPLEFDPDRLRLAPQFSGRPGYSLGQRVRVRVVDSNITRRQVTLELVETGCGPRISGGSAPRRHRKKSKRRGSS